MHPTLISDLLDADIFLHHDAVESARHDGASKNADGTIGRVASFGMDGPLRLRRPR